MTFAVDLMGGETSPHTLYEGVLRAAAAGGKYLVIVTPDINLPSHPNIQIKTASEVITMEDIPHSAIRKKKDATLLVGLRLVAEKKVRGLVTLSNTGAVVIGSRVTLKRQQGVKRPALLAELPTLTGPVAVLDVGANSTYNAEHLVQFAKLGAANRKKRGIKNPRIGLLNIGIEAEKGPLEYQKAYEELSKLPNFLGNVEGKEIFRGVVDVLVTDGFTGNVFLKTAEGTLSAIIESMSLSEGFWKNTQPFALVCGVNGLVVKCHGDTSSDSLYSVLSHFADICLRDSSF